MRGVLVVADALSSKARLCLDRLTQKYHQITNLKIGPYYFFPTMVDYHRSPIFPQDHAVPLTFNEATTQRETPTFSSIDPLPSLGMPYRSGPSFQLLEIATLEERRQILANAFLQASMATYDSEPSNEFPEEVYDEFGHLTDADEIDLRVIFESPTGVIIGTFIITDVN